MASVTEVHTHTDLVIAGHDDVLAAQRFKVGQLYVRLPAGLSVRGKQSVVLFHAEWLPLLFVLAPLNRQSPSVVDVEGKELSLTGSVSMYVGLHVAGLSVFLPIIYLSACQSVCSSLCFIVNISTDI